MKIRNWLFVLIWLLIIFAFSHQSGLAPKLSSAWDVALLFARKLAHFAEFAILTFLLVRALGEDLKLKESEILGLAILVALVCALSDEFHQTFIPKRCGNATDVLIDSLGIFFIAWLYIRRVIKWE